MNLMIGNRNVTPDTFKQYKTKCDHLYHMNRMNSPICNSCTDNVNETSEHALTHCIKHQSIRDKYIN